MHHSRLDSTVGKDSMGNSLSRARQAATTTRAHVHGSSPTIPDGQQPLEETITEQLQHERGQATPMAQQAANNYSESSPPLHPVKTHGESDKRPKETGYDADMLCLKDRGLLELCNDIGMYRNLFALDVSSNQLASLPDSIGNLTKLRRMALGKNNLTSLPDTIGNLHELQWFDATYNQLSCLPSTLPACTNLCSIGISECNFRDFPDVLTSMPQICKLGCYNNLIKTIPPQIANIQSLVKLDLSGNVIKELPDTFCTLTRLSWLNLSNNQLTHLPDDFGNLHGLTELGLCQNKLTRLPDLSRMKQLKLLPLYDNQLTALGEWICNLDSLERLDLSYNHLTELPSSLFLCKSLEVLSVRSNKLMVLPELHGHKCRVPRMDVRDNQLRSIPFWYFHYSLLELKASNNPWLLPHEYSPPRMAARTLGQIIFTHLLQDHNTHLQAYDDIPYKIRRELLKQVHQCDECHYHFCGTPVNVIEFRVVTDDESVPTVLRMCGGGCVSRMQDKISRVMLTRDAVL
jgi:Leucine-rich repeat (LRR) protein